MPEETWTSYADWAGQPHHMSEDRTSDTHPNRESAQAVCNMLYNQGMGCEGVIFPNSVWVIGPDGKLRFERSRGKVLAQ